MLKFRVIYTKLGEEVVLPFHFDNIADARQSRVLLINRQYKNVRILVERDEDNK